MSDNLILNGTFTDATGWSTDGADLTIIQDPKLGNVAHVHPVTGNKRIYHNLTVCDDTTAGGQFRTDMDYTIGFYAKAESPMTLRVGPGSPPSETYEIASEWAWYTRTWRPDQSYTLTFQPQNDVDFYITDVKLIAGGGTLSPTIPLEEPKMPTIIAQAEDTFIDLSDAYSVNLTNEAHVFTGNASGVVNGTQTATSTITMMRGADVVECTAGPFTNLPAGIAVVSDGKKPSPTITVTATSACTAAGVFNIPVVSGDITLNKTFSYSIAKTGATGQTGATGKGVKSTAVDYVASSSGTTIPASGWAATIPTVPKGQYLWTRKTTTYTDNTTAVEYTVAYQGTNGSTGAAGKGVSSTAVTYAVSTSGTTAPTSGWQTAVPTVPKGQYLWTRTITTYTDNSTSTAYSVSYAGTNGTNGTNGKDGADAISCDYTSNAAGNIFRNSGISATLTAHAYKAGKEMTDAEITALGATFKWYLDGGTTAAGTGKTFTLAPGDVTHKAVVLLRMEK